MNKDIFIARKVELISQIANHLAEGSITNQDRISLNKLSEILNQYSFENRFQKKGLLSHTIVDSLQLDYSFGEKFIKFDNDIK